ncbi:MAG: RNA polymerase sigma-70 factor [Ferruginibacter sp.]
MTCDSSAEKILLQKLALGEAAAFSAIYEQYAPLLVSYTVARLSSLAEAKDLIHDLFVYVWEERANLCITHSLRAFLFAAVRYRIIDHIRRNATRDKYAGILLTLSDVEDTNIENELAAKDLRQTIENAVQDLPPRVKEIYQLSREQHYTVSEIATELNLSPQTVKNQLTTALGYLRSIVVKLTVLLICLWKFE